MRQRTGFFYLLSFTAGLICVAGQSAHAALPSLGQAGNYAVYGSSTEILINSEGTAVNGNVALGPLGTLNFQGGIITGGLYHDAGSTLNIAGGSQIQGGVFLIDPTPIDNDAHAAALAAEDLDSTQSFNTLGNGQTIFGDGGLNVINVVTNINLSNGGVLTLIGNGSTDEFLFNVNGTMTLTGASSINLIGVKPEQVLWNFVGDGQEVLFENSTGYGNILAIDRDIRFEGGSNEGSLISNGNRIKLQSGAQVTSLVIPEPTAGLLAALGLSMLLMVRRPAA